MSENSNKSHQIYPVSDWLPDWQVLDNYPGPDATPDTWKWEFLRRHPHYISMWDAIATEYEDREEIFSKAFNLISQEQGNASSVFHSEDPELAPLVAIANNFQLWFGLLNFPPSPKHRIAPSFDMKRFAHSGNGTGRFQSLSIPLRRTEIALIVDLTLSVEEQLASHRRWLLDRRHKAKITYHRDWSDKYTNYLRILDAKELKISDRAIASVLFPKIDNLYPEYAGDRLVKAMFKAAKKRRDRPLKMLKRFEK